MMTGRRRPVSLNRWEWLLDAAALVSLVVAAGTIFSAEAWWIAPALLVATVAVAARRRFPIPAALAAVLISGMVLFEPGIAVPTWVLAEVVLFSLAIRAPRVWTFAVAAAHALVLYGGAVAVFGERPWEPVALILPVWTAAVVATGLALRSNHDYVRALEDQTRSALAFRESEVARHVGDERLRIARDLHDSVAHTVSVISVHAGAAERQLQRDPQRARDALAQVRASSREVVDEMQDILVVLRDSSSSGGVEDVPGADAIASLIATTRDAGVEVRDSIEEGLTLDRSIGVAVYRILQESLTNARKYGTGLVEVDIKAERGGVLVEVKNAIGRPIEEGTGFGMIGMAERAASVHGVLEAGEVAGRFVVRAYLPSHMHSTGGEPR
jgi:signal transduction histidine kinase